MKRLLMAMALTCVLACSISAGDIPSDGAPSANSDPATRATNEPGDVPSVGKSELSNGALSALLSVLSFLT